MMIFDYNYLYSAYPDDASFFLKDIISVKHMVDSLYICPYFPGLNPNLIKFKTAGIGVLKRVQMVVCCMRCIELNTDTLKILGTHFSYNEKLIEEKNLKICKIRKLTLEGKL